MTLPTSDAQPSRHLPRRPQMTPPTHSMPTKPSSPSLPPKTSVTRSTAPGSVDASTYEHAVGFATRSWDLATGGLKTLTAKRELPAPIDRRSADMPVEDWATMRNYVFALVLLACAVLMLFGGGIVLYVMLQP